jgi:hypothetical protein
MRRVSFMTIGLVLLPLVVAALFLLDGLEEWLVVGGYLLLVTVGLVLDLRANRPVPERVKWLLEHPVYRPVMTALFAGFTGAMVERGAWLSAGCFGLLTSLYVLELARDRRRAQELRSEERRRELKARLAVELSTRYAISVDEARAMVDRGVS